MHASQEPEGCLLESDVDEVIPVSQKGSSEENQASGRQSSKYIVREALNSRVCVDGVCGGCVVVCSDGDVCVVMVRECVCVFVCARVRVYLCVRACC